MFGTPPREDPNRPYRYDTKPMVSVSWQDAEALCARLSTDRVRCRLPTEAEWERAARGGLAGRRPLGVTRRRPPTAATSAASTSAPSCRCGPCRPTPTACTR
ncbi:formylglycine-generating enzyme family protein [Thermomonospora umbrina]|uniref:formylglycine-generating enzyme family protein n=1 Tax=Thermomonospora umbrina TaxID=111806 RepID=UPI003CCC4A76